MSKRARITLEPEAVIERKQTPPPAAEPAPGPNSEPGPESTSAPDQVAGETGQRPMPSFKASPPKDKAVVQPLNTGNLIKAALATAALVALVVLWKSRRP